MKILLESALSQTLSFTSRDYPSVVDYTLIQEGTNETVQGVAINTIEVEGFLTINEVFDLKEDNFYSIDIFSNNTLIFRDKIFCTNQDVKDYSINDGDYIEDETYDNNYTIIE